MQYNTEFKNELYERNYCIVINKIGNKTKYNVKHEYNVYTVYYIYWYNAYTVKFEISSPEKTCVSWHKMG